MPDIAAPVLEYIYDLTVKDLSPAFLLVEQSGVIRYWGGKLEIYGINGLKEGDLTEDHAEFLRGFFPFEDEQLNLLCVQTESGVSADVHIFASEKGYWILLLDVTKREAQQTALQQRINEICLIRDRYAKMIDQYLGKSVVEELVRLGQHEKGEGRYVSLLAANIRGITAYSRQHSSQEVFKLLNAYLTAIIQPILDQKGIVDKIAGEAVIGVFGITSDEISPSIQSVTAGIQIIKNVCALRKTTATGGEDYRIDVGIGIASGQAFWGIMGNRNRRTLSAVGYNVDIAYILENQARSNEILIDGGTFGALGPLQSRFRSVSLKLRGFEGSLQAFSCESDERG